MLTMTTTKATLLIVAALAVGVILGYKVVPNLLENKIKK